MARRRIEGLYKQRLQEALDAGQAIEKGEYSRIDVIKEIKIDKAAGDIYSLRFSYDGKTLAVGCRNGAILLLDANTGALMKEIRQTRYGGYPIMCMQFHPMEHHIMLAGSSEGHVYACNTSDGTLKHVVTEIGNEINCLDFCEDGYNFATAGKDLGVRIYDTKTCQIEREYEGCNNSKDLSEVKTTGNTYRVFALKYHPMFNHIFVTGGWDNNIKIWDSRNSQGIVEHISGPHICGDSLDIREYEILTGSWVAKDPLSLWNYTEKKLKKHIPFNAPNGGYLYCAQFCDKDTVLAGGSGTNSAKAICIKTGREIGEVKLDKAVQALDTVSTREGTLFAVAGISNVIKLCCLT